MRNGKSSGMIRKMLACTLGLMAMALSSNALALWKWIDANGQTQYSDRPPPASVPQDRILERPSGYAPPAALPARVTPPEQPQVDPQTQELERLRQQQESEAARQRAAVEQENARRKAEACEQAKHALEVYNSGVRIRDIDENGEYIYLNDAQIQSRRQDAQGKVNEYCK